MKKENTVNTTIRIIVLIASLALMLAGIVLSFQDKTTGATATYGAAILCLIFVFLPAFKKFKGLGIEAELLGQKIEKADNLIHKLQSFSLPTAELLFTNVARAGRWSGAIDRRERDRLRQSIENSLKDMGISGSEIEKTKHDWHRFNLFDMAEDIFQNIDRLTNLKYTKADQRIKGISQPTKPEDYDDHRDRINQRNLVQKWMQEVNSLRQNNDLSNLGEDLKSRIEECPFLSSEEKKNFITENEEAIEDLIFYGKRGQFRRPDVWFSKDD